MSKRGAIVRAAGMLGGISAIVIAATFALNSNQAELTNASLSSGTENLKVAADCTNFSQQDSTAINISMLSEWANYVPGNAKPFCLKDVDPANNMAVSVQADLSSAASTGTLDASKVDVQIVDTTTSNVTNTTLQALETGPVNLNGVNGVSHLAANGGIDDFTINVRLDNGAVLGNAASISHLGLIFTGTPTGV